jgi:twinkle protein
MLLRKLASQAKVLNNQLRQSLVKYNLNYSIYSFASVPPPPSNNDSGKDSDFAQTFQPTKNGNGNGTAAINSSDILEKSFHNANISNNADDKIFVSKHFTVENGEIMKFLQTNDVDYKVRPGNGQIVLKYCFYCPKPHYNQLDNLYTLNIKPQSGAHMCFRCGSKGSWFDLKNAISGFRHAEIGIESAHIDTSRRRVQPPGHMPFDPNQQQEIKYASEGLAYLRHQALKNKEYPKIIQYLTGKGEGERHLTMETLEKYKVGIGYENFKDETGEMVEKPVIYYPMFAPKSDKTIRRSTKKPATAAEEENISAPSTEERKIEGKPEEKSDTSANSISDNHYFLLKNKIRAIGKENKHFQRTEPIGGVLGLFGLNTVPPKSRFIVITEGEYDAMAVYQATGLPAVSLPNGAHSLPIHLLPWLEKYERIYLWMDADEVGRANAVNFATKLGVNRTYLVNTKRNNPEGPKDANDALREDPESLKKYIMEAKPRSQENITTFNEMKGSILNRILKYQDNVGLQSDYFRFYNKKLKGFRRGELTILTGGTGSGKTSFLSQLSLDFAKQGTPTLWGSFEVRNDILATNMLLQYSNVDLIQEPNKFEFYAEQMEKIPLYYLKYFGSTELDKLLNSIEYAIYAFDIGHVLIDNLQFLLSGQGRGIERFEIQDDAISKFRAMATNKNIHVTLVIHPKKVDENQDLHISSVFGSAKATQEADNVMIMQMRPKYRVMEIRKNRFDGDLGKVALGFDKNVKRFIELKEEEVLDLKNTPLTMKDLLERRETLKLGFNETIMSQIEGVSKSKLEKSVDNISGFEETVFNKKEPAGVAKNSLEEDLKQRITEFNKLHKKKENELGDDYNESDGIAKEKLLSKKNSETAIDHSSSDLEKELVAVKTKNTAEKGSSSEEDELNKQKQKKKEELLENIVGNIDTEANDKTQTNGGDSNLYSMRDKTMKEGKKTKTSFYGEEEKEAIFDNLKEFMGGEANKNNKYKWKKGSYNGEGQQKYNKQKYGNNNQGYKVSDDEKKKGSRKNILEDYIFSSDND